MPSSCRFQYSPLKAGSVSFLRVMKNRPVPSCFCHSASLLTILSTVTTPLRSPASVNSTIETDIEVLPAPAEGDEFLRLAKFQPKDPRPAASIAKTPRREPLQPAFPGN